MNINQVLSMSSKAGLIVLGSWLIMTANTIGKVAGVLILLGTAGHMLRIIKK